MSFISWFLHVIGVEPRQPSTAYNFFSGAGSDLGEITIIGLGIGAFRHVNCHQRGCWRLGRHPVAGGLFKVCSHHHPDVPDDGPTAEHIAAAHQAALERTPS